MSFKRHLQLPLLSLSMMLAGVGCYVQPASANPDALWNIISQKCVPDQRNNGQPAPCSQVDEKEGFVVMKDMNGPLQFLLMPTAKISGMESPVLLEDKTPNFFAEAWQARHFMSDKYGKPIDDSHVSLAINSQSGRTQNQLHIHISCLLPEVRKTLDKDAGAINEQWQALPDTLVGHTYLARRITAAQLGEKGAFRVLADGVPAASKNMGHFGMAMVSLKGGDFLLLAIERNLWTFNKASAEEIQDHDCAVLNNPAS